MRFFVTCCCPYTSMVYYENNSKPVQAPFLAVADSLKEHPSCATHFSPSSPLLLARSHQNVIRISSPAYRQLESNDFVQVNVTPPQHTFFFPHFCRPKRKSNLRYGALSAVIAAVCVSPSLSIRLPLLPSSSSLSLFPLLFSFFLSMALTP